MTSSASSSSASTAVVGMPAVGSEVEVFGVIVEVIFFEKTLELFSRSKLDPAWTVDVDVPPSGLFTMLAAF